MQEKKYSHAAQERHIIHDTYTGLEYRYRETLARILEMAEQGEFDLLCMDVLDRGLGRRALARELFRMQLRELGIRVLTTQESDHADDDSLEGQIARLSKGRKAEEEITDLIEPDGTEWTEVKVVVFIFESAAAGVSTHQIAAILNEKGIPTPYTTKGRRQKGMKEDLVWQPRTRRRILNNIAYYGEYRQFRHATVGRAPELEQLTETETFCYTVQKRSWPPSGVSYDSLRKTRIYRLY
jgi:hypothetical protein